MFLRTERYFSSRRARRKCSTTGTTDSGESFTTARTGFQSCSDEQDSRKEDQPPMLQTNSQTPGVNISSQSTAAREGGIALLEILPAELRYQIVPELRLNDYRSLVRASPVFFEDYLRECDALFRHRMWAHMRCIQIDAWAVLTTRSMGASGKRTKGGVLEFLEQYTGLRDRNACVLKTVPPDGLMSMFSYHQLIVRPWVYAFAEEARRIFDAENKDWTLHGQPGVSRTEEVRFLRAIYRFQLFINLFGPCLPSMDLTEDAFSPVEILDAFFCTFEPYEVHEIYCFGLFLRKKLHKSNSSKGLSIFGDQTSWLPAFRWLTDIGNKDFDITESCPGLERFMAFVKPGRAPPRVREQFVLLATVRHMMDTVLSIKTQQLRRQLRTSDQDLKEQSREGLPFWRDRKVGYSVGWSNLCSRYYNWYGPAVPEPLNQWAFLMWDNSRYYGVHSYRVTMKYTMVIWTAVE